MALVLQAALHLFLTNMMNVSFGRQDGVACGRLLAFVHFCGVASALTVELVSVSCATATGWLLGFFLGFLLLIWVWQDSVSTKQKAGIFVGVGCNMAVTVLRHYVGSP